jgi:hypothetical protein
LATDKKLQDKTLEALINGRVIDTIYIPNDPQAVYDLQELLEQNKKDAILNFVNDKEHVQDAAIAKLEKHIKETSDKITLRSIAGADLLAIKAEIDALVEKLGKDAPIPFEKDFNTLRFLKACVCIKQANETIYSGDDEKICAYLKCLRDAEKTASYVRIFNKIDAMMLTASAEQRVMESIDFLS